MHLYPPQFGRGTVEPAPTPRQGFEVEVYKYKPSLEPDIQAADLVISHCGQPPPPALTFLVSSTTTLGALRAPRARVPLNNPFAASSFPFLLRLVPCRYCRRRNLLGGA